MAPGFGGGVVIVGAGAGIGLHTRQGDEIRPLVGIRPDIDYVVGQGKERIALRFIEVDELIHRIFTIGTGGMVVEIALVEITVGEGRVVVPVGTAGGGDIRRGKEEVALPHGDGGIEGFLQIGRVRPMYEEGLREGEGAVLALTFHADKLCPIGNEKVGLADQSLAPGISCAAAAAVQAHKPDVAAGGAADVNVGLVCGDGEKLHPGGDGESAAAQSLQHGFTVGIGNQVQTDVFAGGDHKGGMSGPQGGIKAETGVTAPSGENIAVVPDLVEVVACAGVPGFCHLAVSHGGW